MKKNDYICLFLSIVINIAIVFVLAMFLTDEIVETDEIKIGLVAVESDASTRFKGEKNVDAKKQNLEADSIEKKEENKPQEEKPIEKPSEVLKLKNTGGINVKANIEQYQIIKDMAQKNNVPIATFMNYVLWHFIKSHS